MAQDQVVLAFGRVAVLEGHDLFVGAADADFEYAQLNMIRAAMIPGSGWSMTS